LILLNKNRKYSNSVNAQIAHLFYFKTLKMRGFHKRAIIGTSSPIFLSTPERR